MKKYIHIGFPKCASTALQTHYFSKLDNVFHLGSSGGGTVAPYVHEKVRIAIEVELRMAKDFVYQREVVNQVFDSCFSHAEFEGYSACGMSSESMAFTMHHDVDITQKALRLKAAFGDNTSIIIVVRKQPDLLRSLYREYVISGISLRFEAFINAIYANRMRSVFHDLEYAKVYRLYSNLFGAENVYVVPFELLEFDPQQVISCLDRAVGVKSGMEEIPQENTGLSDVVIEKMRQLNAKTRHNMGKSVLEPVNNFRYKEYYGPFKGLIYEAQLEEETINRHIKVANEMSTLGRAEKVDYSCDPDVYDEMLKVYGLSNKELASLTGLDFAALGYPE